ncbi:MAG: sodium:proton antiporter [Sediminispirochaetaceae bacterium]
MDRILIILLFCIGLWGILVSRSLIRKVIGLSILNSAVVILFILSGRMDGVGAPILSAGQEGTVVDPLPQALMLTAIVIGLSVTAVALILSVKLYRACGSLDIKEIEESVDESSH